MTAQKRATPNLSLDDILRILRERMPELREKYHVKSLAVFGSYVRGEQRPGSDLDVLVEFEQGSGTTLFDLVDLQDMFAEATGLRIDLVTRGSLRGERGRRILEEVLSV